MTMRPQASASTTGSCVCAAAALTECLTTLSDVRHFSVVECDSIQGTGVDGLVHHNLPNLQRILGDVFPFM